MSDKLLGIIDKDNNIISVDPYCIEFIENDSDDIVCERVPPSARIAAWYQYEDDDSDSEEEEEPEDLYDFVEAICPGTKDSPGFDYGKIKDSNGMPLFTGWKQNRSTDISDELKNLPETATVCDGESDITAIIEEELKYGESKEKQVVDEAFADYAATLEQFDCGGVLFDDVIHCELCRCDSSNYGQYANTKSRYSEESYEDYNIAYKLKSSDDYKGYLTKNENDLLFRFNMCRSSIMAPHIDKDYGTSEFNEYDFKVFTKWGVGFVNATGQRVYAHGMYFAGNYVKTENEVTLSYMPRGTYYSVLRFSDGNHYLVYCNGSIVYFKPAMYLRDSFYIKADGRYYGEDEHTIRVKGIDTVCRPYSSAKHLDTACVHDGPSISFFESNRYAILAVYDGSAYTGDGHNCGQLNVANGWYFCMINSGGVKRVTGKVPEGTKLTTTKDYIQLVSFCDTLDVNLGDSEYHMSKRITTAQFLKLVKSCIMFGKLNMEMMKFKMKAMECQPDNSCLIRTLNAMGISYIYGHWECNNVAYLHDVCSKSRSWLNPCNCRERFYSVPFLPPRSNEKVRMTRFELVEKYDLKKRVLSSCQDKNNNAAT